MPRKRNKREDVSDLDPEDPRSDYDMEVEWAMQQRWNAEKPRRFYGDGYWRTKPATEKQIALAKEKGIPYEGLNSGELSDLIDEHIRRNRVAMKRSESLNPLRHISSAFRSYVDDYVDRLLGVAFKHHGDF